MVLLLSVAVPAESQSAILMAVASEASVSAQAQWYENYNYRTILVAVASEACVSAQAS